MIDTELSDLFIVQPNTQGMSIIWTRPLYIPIPYYAEFTAIAKQFIGGILESQAIYQMQRSLIHLLQKINRNGDLHTTEERWHLEQKEDFLTLGLPPSCTMAVGNSSVRNRMSTIRKTNMPKKKLKTGRRIEKLENDVNRLCKHVGKLTNQLKKQAPTEKIFFEDQLNSLKNININMQLPGEIHQVEIKGTIEEPKVLHLEIGKVGQLLIKYGTNVMGSITHAGEMYMLDDILRRDVYREWTQAFIEEGINKNKSIDTTPVVWKEKAYQIYLNFTDVFLVGPKFTGIYNITCARPCQQIKDDNILTYSNGTPILF